ncbi:FxsA family protein [Salinimonas chungwhensis]|uniref:FxsA family protein n=1 Tax=Salinimonas chungwhensis TaxID=265425 RepID=UPI00037F0BAE|nr:FxsA family protein [Salinimonas chungwhensis]
MRVLFLLFAIMPIIEIALLVQVGGMIGGWNTIALVILSALIGSYLVRREGLATLQTAQSKMQRNEIPGDELVQGLMLVVAGVLLVTPGFVTDILGLLFVIPGSRQYLARNISKHLKARVVTSSTFTSGQNPFNQHSDPFSRPDRDENGDIIEGEYTDKSGQDDNNRLR